MNKKLYTRVFFSVIISVFITTVFISAILFQYFANIILEQTYSMMAYDLRLVNQSTDYMVKNVKEMSIRLHTDWSISKLRYSVEPSNSDVDIALSQLNYLRNTSPFIDSIYIYNGKTGYFYVSSSNKIDNSVIEENGFYDKDIINKYESLKNFTPVPRRINNPNLNSSDEKNIVYTFMYCDTLELNKKPEYAIIVNISSDWASQVTNGLNRDLNSNIFILDNKGMVVSKTYKYSFLENLSQESFLKDITSTNDSKEGYLIKDLAGTKSLVSFYQSDICEWTYVLTAPYESIMNRVRNLRNNTIMIASLILIFALLLSFPIFSRMFKPVNNVIAQLKRLEADNEKSRDTLKNAFLRNLIVGNNYLDNDSVKEESKKFDIKIDLVESKLLLVQLKIDNYKQFCEKYNYKDRHFIKKAVNDRINDICSGTFKSETIDVGEEDVVLLLNITTQMEEDGYIDIIEAIVRKIQEDIFEYISISISVVISKPDFILSPKTNLYADIQDTSLQKFAYGPKCIMFVTEKYEDKQEYNYPAHKEKLLIDNLMSGRLNEAKITYNEIVNDLKKQQYSTLMFALTHLLYNISTAIETIQKNGILPLNKKVNLIKTLYDAETLENLNIKLLDIFDEIALKMQDKKSTSRDSVVNKITEVINNEYTNQDLSVEYFANMFNMSSAYIGKAFKSTHNETIGDYISRKRMDKAQELLLNTGCTIEKVAERIGFSSSIYFFKCFKKYFGVTPGEFRIKNKLNDL